MKEPWSKEDWICLWRFLSLAAEEIAKRHERPNDKAQGSAASGAATEKKNHE
jgi:hypothetical protein